MRTHYDEISLATFTITSGLAAAAILVIVLVAAL